MIENKRRISVPILILCFLAVLAVNIDPKIKDLDGDLFVQFCSSIKSYNIISVFLFPLIYVLLFSANNIFKNITSILGRLCVAIPAALFALFMIFGNSFENYNNWQQVFYTGGGVQLLKSSVIFVGYFSLFTAGIVYIFHFFDGKNIFSMAPSSSLFIRYYGFLERYPLRATFLTLFLLYIPCIIASYPALVHGDFPAQVLQAYNLSEWTSNYLNLISEEVKLNNHHPITHTLLIHLCLKIGNAIFLSYNIGIFIYAFSQCIIVTTAYSYIISCFIKEKVNKFIIFCLILYLGLSPKIQNYLLFASKDVLFSVFLLFFIYYVYCYSNNKLILYQKVGFIFSALGILLFRNDGIYIVVLTLAFYLIVFHKARKTISMLLIVVFFFSLCFNNILLPAFKITPGSKREMLSIPFQQTARYLRDAGDDVSAEEKAAISGVFNYQWVSTHYDPNTSDIVKNNFNENASTLELLNYFKAWFSMLLKHPGIYVQATMNNYYQYFYPGREPAIYYGYSWSADRFEYTNKSHPEIIDFNFHYPEKLNAFRNWYEKTRENIFKIPPFSILQSPATYTWCLILWFAYCIKHKAKRAISFSLPLGVVLLICMAGPCNGAYFRYLYPIAVILPFTVLWGVDSIQNERNSNER